MFARVIPRHDILSAIPVPMDHPDRVIEAITTAFQLHAVELLYGSVGPAENIRGRLGSLERLEDDLTAALNLANHLSAERTIIVSDDHTDSYICVRICTCILCVVLKKGESNEAAFEVVKTACHFVRDLSMLSKGDPELLFFNSFFEQVLQVFSQHDLQLSNLRELDVKMDKERLLRLKDFAKNAKQTRPSDDDHDEVIKRMMDGFHHVRSPPRTKIVLRIRKHHRGGLDRQN